MKTWVHAIRSNAMSRLPWVVPLAWIALAPLAPHASGTMPWVGILPAGVALLLAGTLTRSPVPAGAKPVLLLLGLVLVYSYARDATVEIPAWGGKVLRLALTRLLLLTVPVAFYFYTRKGRLQTRPGLLGYVKASIAALGVLVGVGVLVFTVVGEQASENITTVLGPLALNLVELLMLVLLSIFMVERGSSAAARREVAGPAPEGTRPSTSDQPLGAWMLLLVLVAVPFSSQLDFDRSSGTSQSVRLPLVDPLIWVGAAVELLRIFRASLRVAGRRERVEFWRRETLGGIDPVLVLLPLIGVLSLLASRSPTMGWKDALQMLDTYIVSCWLIQRWLRGAAAHAVLGTGLTVLFGLMAGASLWQIFRGTPPYLIRSLFPERQSLLAAIVLLAPIVWCYLQSGRAAWIRRGGSVLVGLGSVASGAVIAAPLVVGQLLAAGAMTRRKWLPNTPLILGTALLAFVVLPSGYRNGLLAESRTWVTVPMGERRTEVILAKHFMKSHTPQVHFQAGPRHVFANVSIDDWTRSYSAPKLMEADSLGQRVFQEYYAESWSALRLIGRNSLIGSGIGTWEREIGTGFGYLERTGTTFANTYNGYLLLGVTLGPLGLMAWLLLFGISVRRARAFAPKGRVTAGSWVGAGSLAGLLGAGVVMLFCPIATLPLGVYWVLLSSAVRDESALG